MKDLILSPSRNQSKKYDAFEITKDGNIKFLTSFGARRYQHYYDRLGFFKDLNHNDKKRKANYYKRHNKDYEKYSADWFSKVILWGEAKPLKPSRVYKNPHIRN